MWWRRRAGKAGFRLGRALKPRLPGKHCVEEFDIDVDVIVVVVVVFVDVVDIETISFFNGDGWGDVASEVLLILLISVLMLMLIFRLYY